MKAIIIAGGEGKRLGQITKKLPKPLVLVGDKRVMEHQIDLLVRSGVKEIWILIGYKGDMIRDYIGNGNKWNIKIYYSLEKESLGTAGAVKSIAGKLPDDFLVLYGDIMVNFDIERFISFHRKYGRNGLATIVVHPNDHPLESDLVEVKNNQVVNIYPKPHSTGIWRHNLVSAAVYILSPKIFSFIPFDKASDFGKNIFPKLLKNRKKIIAYRTWEYFRDMGNSNRLRTVRKDYRLGVYKRLSYQRSQKAIFLESRSLIDNFRINHLSYSVIKKINRSEFHAIVLSNHSAVVMDEMHRKLETLLGERGVKIDAFYYNSHYIGIIRVAVENFNIDLDESYFIGDPSSDCRTIKDAKIRSVGIGKNYDKAKEEKIFLKRNLAEAVDYIIGQ